VAICRAKGWMGGQVGCGSGSQKAGWHYPADKLPPDKLKLMGVGRNKLQRVFIYECF
jgi:hypothetical protein